MTRSASDKAALDNRSRQLDSHQPEFHRSRGLSEDAAEQAAAEATAGSESPPAGEPKPTTSK